MEKIKKRLSSIKVSLIISIGISLITAQSLYLLASYWIDSLMLALLYPRPEALLFKGQTVVFFNINESEIGLPVISDPSLFETLKVIKWILPMFIFSLCIVLCVILFYKFKLKKSIAILEFGIKKIEKQELDFSMHTENNDELGDLCIAFENMRKELSDSFEAMWKSEENQRNLYRAFAHDLRTPLTIIKGNNEIIQYVALKNNDWKQVLQAVSQSDGAVERIEFYAKQLQRLENIDDWNLQPNFVDMEDFTNTLMLQCDVLASKSGKNIDLQFDNIKYARFDRLLIFRVLDNLLDNAFCHANNQVLIEIRHMDDKLVFSISDDGAGFSKEALKRATEPFYSTQKPNGHLGIGLSLCKKLLEKQNSNLKIVNTMPHGAKCEFFILV